MIKTNDISRQINSKNLHSPWETCFVWFPFFPKRKYQWSQQWYKNIINKHSSQQKSRVWRRFGFRLLQATIQKLTTGTGKKQIQVAAKFAKDDLKVRRILMITQNDNSYAKMLSEYFRINIDRLRGKVVKKLEQNFATGLCLAVSKNALSSHSNQFVSFQVSFLG